MRSRIILGAGTLLCIGASLVVACRDTPTTLERSNLETPRGAPTASAARARLDQRNPSAWVGAAHNRILDDWRKEMRKPGVLTHNLCSYIIDFSTRDERMPADKRTPLPARRQAISAALKTSKLCQSAAANRSGPSALASYGNTATRRLRQSDALTVLASQIEEAITVAETSSDLAVRLNSVLDAAASLDETDQTVVSATVSVAQSSYEYWESQFPAVVDEVGSEYGACAADRSAAGYTMEAARDACVSGTYYESSYRGWSPSSFLGPIRFPGSVSFRCGPGLREGFKHIARNDARGAFSGGFAGAFGGAAGIVSGALIGGASSSIWAAGENAWSTYWCMMK